MKTVAGTALGILAWLVLLSGLSAFAEEKIYKTVDEHGRVTYSSTPTAGNTGALTLDVPPPPTVEQAKEAEERVQRLDEATDKAEKQRREREQAERSAGEQVGIYITPGPVIGDSLAPYTYPAYGNGYWHNPPPYRQPGHVSDRPSRPPAGTRPRPAPRR